MNSDTLSNQNFITPNKKGFFPEENLYLLNTNYTTKENDNIVISSNVNITPFQTTCKNEEPLTSPLIKTRRRSISPDQSESLDDDNSSRSNHDNVFDLNFNKLKKRNLFHIQTKESSSDREGRNSFTNLLKYENISTEHLCNESIKIINDLKGSVLLHRLETGNSNNSVNLTKIFLKPFFDVNKELLSRIIKDIINSIIEGFNKRDNKLFFKYFIKSTEFDIIESGMNNISECLMFLEENILKLDPYENQSQTDFKEKDDKFIYSIKGECKMCKNQTYNFIISLMISVNLTSEISNIAFINELIAITDIKMLILESN